MSELKKNNFRPKLPPWIRVRVSCGPEKEQVSTILKGLKLNTVCEGAECPNMNECWHRKTATFMILGASCTRNCKFCAVSHDPNPLPPEPDEPQRVAEAAAKLSLKYIVVTSVTRDDLPDGGAAHFAAVIRELKKAVPGADVEVLTPDFNADENAIRTVLDAAPAVFNHNVETVERLSKKIRSKADFRRSLKVLSAAVRLSSIPVKSGFMVGMGETDEEVIETIDALFDAGVSILTVGQYLPPSARHWKLERYVEPEKFKEWENYALKKGFSFVACSPLVRSSYNAAELVDKKKFL